MISATTTAALAARRRRRRSGGKRSIGPAARKCKGRSAGAFRACVRRVMRGGKA